MASSPPASSRVARLPRARMPPAAEPVGVALPTSTDKAVTMATEEEDMQARHMQTLLVSKTAEFSVPVDPWSAPDQRGFSLEVNGDRLYVGSVDADHSGRALQLQAGDHIVALDGEPVGAASLEAFAVRCEATAPFACLPCPQTPDWPPSPTGA